MHDAVLPECSRQNEAQWKKIEKSETDIIEMKLEARDMQGEIKLIKREISQHVAFVVTGLTVLFELVKYFMHK